jgi:PAS domain S-box-containing protein
MKDFRKRNIISKYILYGILIGLIFPILAISLELFVKQLPLSWYGIKEAHLINPILWIVNSAPFILGFISYLVGKNVAEKTEELQQNADAQIKKAEKIFSFTEKLAEGEIDVEYDFNGRGKSDDNIGLSLVKLRDYLKRSQEEEAIRRDEEQQQNWTTQGLAKFGDILRQNNDNINELSYNIISNLVNYIDAKQGGFFVINDTDPNDKHFELTACYAYSRKKFLEKRIEWEEGLVGACALEKNTIILTEIPDQHVTITSGLGETIPDCLVLVPLKINEEIHGVIELASLKVFSKYEIEFIEKLAESIASVISSVKINIQTSRLLKDSQEQAKILALQEDEMRRNMEELSYAKEEAAKQGELLENFTNAVNHTLVRAEYSTSGILLYANTRFLSKLGYSSNKEVEGKHISMFINEKDKDWFFKIWGGLSKGGKHFEGDMKHVTKQGKDFWSMATYTSVRNSDGSIEKILFLGIDITDQKKQNLDYEGQIEALNLANLKVEYAPDGGLMDANSKFIEFTEINQKGLDKFTVNNFIEEGTEENFKTIWANILKGIPFENQVPVTLPSGEKKWMQGTFTAVRDMYGDVSKIIYLASDITQRKKIELEMGRQTKQLKEQEEQLKLQQQEIQKQHEEFREKTQQQINEIVAVKTRNEKTLEGTLDAIITINHYEKIEFFNRAAEKLWGINRTSVIGKSVKNILPPPHNNVDDGKIIEFLMSEKNHLKGNRTEVNIINKNGEEIPVLVTLSEVKIGNQYTYTAFIQNISVELF